MPLRIGEKCDILLENFPKGKSLYYNMDICKMQPKGRGNMQTDGKKTLPEKIPIPSCVRQTLETLERAGQEAYCVGGCVRDSLLGQDAAGLGRDHLRPAGTDAGALRRPRRPHGDAARHGYGALGRGERGGYHLPPGRRLPGPPPPGQRVLHPLTGGGPGAAGTSPSMPWR